MWCIHSKRNTRLRGGKHQERFSVSSRTEKKLNERQDIFKATYTSSEVKRYSRELMGHIKEEEMYKILIDRAFNEDKDSPFKKIEPHKKFNTQWGTIFNRSLVEFMKEEILEMCHKDVTDICMPRRDDDNRLMRKISWTHI